MSDDRKEPGVAFWATVVVVVMLLYPITFGPACWMASRTDDQQLPVAYLPIARLICNSPDWIRDALIAYVVVGISPGSHIYVPFDSDSVMEIP